MNVSINLTINSFNFKDMCVILQTFKNSHIKNYTYV